MSFPSRDRALLHALRMAADAHGLREPPRVRLSASIESPQLIGPCACGAGWESRAGGTCIDPQGLDPLDAENRSAGASAADAPSQALH